MVRKLDFPRVVGTDGEKRGFEAIAEETEALGVPVNFEEFPSPWAELQRALVEVGEDGVVKVRLTGACGGCPMSQMTLRMGIERILKKEVPEVKQVVAL